MGGKTNERLEEAQAGELQVTFNDDGVHPPHGPREELTYLDRQIARLERAFRNLRHDELTPVMQLEERYESGRKLQTDLVEASGIPETPTEQGEADGRAKREACGWAKETWQARVASASSSE